MSGFKPLIIYFITFIAIIHHLIGDDGEPKFVDGQLVFPFRETNEKRLKFLESKKEKPLVRTLPEGMAYPVIPQETATNFAQYLVELARDYQLPGFAFAIVQNDTVTMKYHYGLRNIKTREPINEETLFNIGSVTQALTSLLAASMNTESLSYYEVPVYKIKRDFKVSNPNSIKQITLKSLLNMTAGIPDYTDSVLDPAWSRPEDVFEVIAQSPILAKPGEIYNHSQVSIACAGYILSVIDDKNSPVHENYIKLVEEKLFEPMGIENATFSIETARAYKNYAAAHKLIRGEYQTVAYWEPSINTLAPAVGLKANINDMTKWLTTELREGLTASQQRIAPSRDIVARWVPHNPSAKNYFGMGWTRLKYKKTDIISNTGSYDRHTASMGMFPSYRTGFILLINAHGEGPQQLAKKAALGLTEMLIEIKEKTISQSN